MRSAAIVTGVLGTGTVLVFALAGLVATLFPSGALVNASWNGGCINCGGGLVAPAIPMPAPGVVVKGGVMFDANGNPVVDANGNPVFPTGTDGDLLPQP
jgi:hypothetical protein